MQTIKKSIGQGSGKGDIYNALAYDPNDIFGGLKIKSIMHDTTYREYFRDSGLYIYSSADGQLDIAADTAMTLTAPSITLTSTTLTTVTGPLLVQTQRADATQGYENYTTFQGYFDATYAEDTEGETRGILIEFARIAGTVTVGNTRDQALKLSLTDYVGGHEAGYFIRAFDIQTKYDASGETITAIYGGNITSYIKHGTVGTSYVQRLGMKCDGVISGEFVGLVIQSESQGSISGDSMALQFSTSAINPATGAVTYVMEVAPANTSGFDAFIHFTDGDKTDGCYTSGSITAQTCDAIYKVVIGSNAYFCPLYTAEHTTGSW